MGNSASQSIISDRVQSPAARIALSVFGAALFAAITALCAQVRIPLPFTPVPVTLQVFAVLLTGAVLGLRAGVASQALYMGAGAIGLPVFTGAMSGLAYMAGPTGGYLLGFVLAPLCVAGVMGKIRGEVTPGRMAAAMAAGVAAIYVCGWAWLAFGIHFGPAKAFFQGVHPFVYFDLVKAAAAAALFLPFRRYVK